MIGQAPPGRPMGISGLAGPSAESVLLLNCRASKVGHDLPTVSYLPACLLLGKHPQQAVPTVPAPQVEYKALAAEFGLRGRYDREAHFEGIQVHDAIRNPVLNIGSASIAAQPHGQLVIMPDEE